MCTFTQICTKVHKYPSFEEERRIQCRITKQTTKQKSANSVTNTRQEELLKKQQKQKSAEYLKYMNRTKGKITLHSCSASCPFA